MNTCHFKKLFCACWGNWAPHLVQLPTFQVLEEALHVEVHGRFGHESGRTTSGEPFRNGWSFLNIKKTPRWGYVLLVDASHLLGEGLLCLLFFVNYVLFTSMYLIGVLILESKFFHEEHRAPPSSILKNTSKSWTCLCPVFQALFGRSSYWACLGDSEWFCNSSLLEIVVCGMILFQSLLPLHSDRSKTSGGSATPYPSS